MIALDDVRYGEAGGRALLLDLRRPDPLPASPAPVLVWIHGGGWEAGDRRDDILAPMVPALVGAGFVTVSIDYRLSDEACFPAQIHDAKAAIRWLRANAAELGIDPDRIGVWGHSAGAHLAALLGTTADLAELEGQSGSPGHSTEVQAVLPVSGPTDLLSVPAGWTNAEPDRAASRLFGGPLDERRELVRLGSPVAHVQPGGPPFLIVHGEADEVVPVEQADLLHDALRRAGRDSTLVRLPRADHLLAALDLGITAVDAWRDVLQRALAFFGARLPPAS